MQKITPFLWFDNQAEEAAGFYTGIFKNSGITNIVRNTEGSPTGLPGTALTVAFNLAGQPFTALNGGPVFTFTPAISFYVRCDTEAEVDDLYAKLSVNGKVLMPLQQYPFSKRFAWIEDKYGLSWQLNLAVAKQKIVPCLAFAGAQSGKAEAAINFYASVFSHSGIEHIVHYAAGEPGPEGAVKHATFSLENQEFTAMDTGQEHSFTFNEAVSFVVNCESQSEVDYFWEKLAEDGREVECGWLKDKYGVSWQVVPVVLPKLLQHKDPAKARRVMQAMLKMKKLDIAALEQA